MAKNIRELRALIVVGSLLLSGCGSGGPTEVAADHSTAEEIVVSRYELPPVDFREAARTEAFTSAVEDFERESEGTGEQVAVVGLPGAAGFRIATETVNQKLWDWNRAYRGRGAYVFRYDDAFGYGRDAVILLPTADQWVVLDAAGTDGVNLDLSHEDVVRGLRELDKSHPFVLTEAGLDYVAGSFLQPVADADKLAKRLYRFCPDIVDQGTETVARLAEELEESQELYCWWD